MLAPEHLDPWTWTRPLDTAFGFLYAHSDEQADRFPPAKTCHPFLHHSDEQADRYLSAKTCPHILTTRQGDDDMSLFGERGNTVTAFPISF